MVQMCDIFAWDGGAAFARALQLSRARQSRVIGRHEHTLPGTI